MDNTLSKQLLLSILGLAILIVAIVGISYAVLVEPNSSLISNDIVYIDYDTDTDGISLIGTLPMKDSEGIGMSSYLDFKVISNVSSNNALNYEILLERVKDDDYTLLGNNEVRIYLEKFVNGRYVPVDNYPSYFTSTLANNIINTDNSSNSMILYSGVFRNTTEDTKQFCDNYRLKIWTDEETVIGSSSKNFKAVVRVNYNLDV